MAVSILAALGLGGIAAAASFPSGFGFGAGYGSGVRAGYDIIYPRIAPYVDEIIKFLVPQYEAGQTGTEALTRSTGDSGSRFRETTQRLPEVIRGVTTVGSGSSQEETRARQPEVIVNEDEELRRQLEQLVNRYNAADAEFTRLSGRVGSGGRFGTSQRAADAAGQTLTREYQNLERFLSNHPELRSLVNR